MNLIKIVEFSAILSLFATSMSCKPRHQQSGLTAGRSAKGEPKDCRAVISDPEKIRLLNEVQRINRDFVKGQIPLDARTTQLEAMMRHLESQPNQRRLLRSIILSESAEVAHQQLILNLVRFIETGESSLTASNIAVFEAFDLSPTDGSMTGSSRQVLQVLREAVLPHYQALKSLGFTYDYQGQTGWNLSKENHFFDISTGGLRSHAQVLTGLLLFGSPQLHAALVDPKRQETVFLDNIAFMPPGRVSNQRGSVEAWPLKNWNTATQKLLVKWQETFEEMTKSAQVRATSAEQLKLVNLIDILRGESPNALEGKNSSDIDHEGSQTRLRMLTETLIRDFGISKPVRMTLRNHMIEQLKLDNKNLDQGINGMYGRLAGVIAAPIVGAIVVATAPATLGGGMIILPAGASFTYVAATSTAALGAAATGATASSTATALLSNATIAQSAYTSILTGLTFTGALISGSAAIKSGFTNTSLACNFSEEFAATAPVGLMTAPLFGLVPIGTGAVGNAVATFKTAQAGLKVYLGLNTSAAVALLGFGGMQGTQQYRRCYDILDQLDRQIDNGDTAGVEGQISLAMSSCLESGINLGFATHGANKARTSLVEVASYIRNNKLLSQYGGGGTTGLRQEQKKFLTNDDAKNFVDELSALVNEGAGENVKLRDIPAEGTVNGTVTSYPMKTSDGWVARIRAYTSRAANVVGMIQHKLSAFTSDTSKLEMKIPDPIMAGVVRKPTISVKNATLAKMFASLESFNRVRSSAIAEAVALNPKEDPNVIAAMLGKIGQMHSESPSGGQGPLPRALTIMYERVARSAKVKAGDEYIDVQITVDTNVNYSKSPEQVPENWRGPYQDFFDGMGSGQVPSSLTIVELKVPVRYAKMYQDDPEALRNISQSLFKIMRRYDELKAVVGGGKGKSAYFRNTASRDSDVINKIMEDGELGPSP
jgi:hypothetical protein